MSECLMHLDAVLKMADQEYTALASGDLDTAEQLCAARDTLTSQAMRLADTAPRLEFIDRLIALQKVQTMLYDEAKRRREDLRSELFRSKQETKRLNGYRKAVHMGM